MGFDALLSGYVSRAFFVLTGVAGILFCIWVLIVAVRRAFGIGEPTDMERMISSHRGDVVEAAAGVRTMPVVILGMLVWAVLVASAGLLGPRFSGIAPLAFISAIGGTILLGAWGWIEKEFAFPGFLVDRSVKGIPGRFFARRRGFHITAEDFLKAHRDRGDGRSVDGGDDGAEAR